MEPRLLAAVVILDWFESFYFILFFWSILNDEIWRGVGAIPPSHDYSQDDVYS